MLFYRYNISLNVPNWLPELIGIHALETITSPNGHRLIILYISLGLTLNVNPLRLISVAAPIRLVNLCSTLASNSLCKVDLTYFFSLEF